MNLVSYNLVNVKIFAIVYHHGRVTLARNSWSSFVDLWGTYDVFKFGETMLLEKGVGLRID